jgi:hypothetical protein
VAKKQNVIELNGKRYDAYTGAFLSDVTARKPLQAVAHAQQSVDGFERRSHEASHAQPVAIAHPGPRTSDVVAKPITDVVRPGAKHVAHHSPHKSSTLMRSTVKKPTGSLKHTASSHTHALVVQPAIPVHKKLSHPQVDPSRVLRAKRVPRSDSIRRYAVAAQALPAAALRPIPAAIKPVHASTPAAHAVATPHPAATSMDIFEKALQAANSHLETTPTKHKKARGKRGRRILSVGAATLAVLLIAGFVALQNQAKLTIRYASSKAGIHATLPATSPLGYSPGKVSYSAGTVGVRYTNGSSGQGFTLSQTASNWNSQSLRDSFVAVKDKRFQTLEAAGRTVYTYGDNNATWVNGGIWYNVTSDGSLTTDELLDLAKNT